MSIIVAALCPAYTEIRPLASSRRAELLADGVPTVVSTATGLGSCHSKTGTNCSEESAEHFTSTRGMYRRAESVSSCLSFLAR